MAFYRPPALADVGEFIPEQDTDEGQDPVRALGQVEIRLAERPSTESQRMVDVFKLMTQTSVLDFLRQSDEAPTDAALYLAIMSSIEQSDRSFGRLVESCEKEMLPVVSPIHGYGHATMQ